MKVKGMSMECVNIRIVLAYYGVSSLSQWFLKLLPNQALAAELAAKAWFDRSFKNH